MAEYEVRKLPKRTIIYMAIVVVMGIIGFFVIMESKELKVEKILHALGYKNVANITVFADHEFLNEEINIKGKQYSIEFTNLDDGKKCNGFVFKDFKRNVMEDLECK